MEEILKESEEEQEGEIKKKDGTGMEVAGNAEKEGYLVQRQKKMKKKKQEDEWSRNRRKVKRRKRKRQRRKIELVWKWLETPRKV